MNGTLTVGQLRERLADLPAEAPVFVYVAGDTTIVQAEPVGSEGVRFLTARIHVGGGGGAS